MQRVESILDLVGSTPMVRMQRLAPASGARIWAKLESFNPGGSVKDRVAKNMIEAAEAEGHLQEGGVIVEPTSGNTGIGLAMVAAAKGYRTILCMPDSLSVERRSLLQAYGAELVLTPGQMGMKGAIAEAEKICQSTPGSFMPHQFMNPANPDMHRKTTALEILEQMHGKVDAFVAGIGTGGTITGVGEILRQEIPDIEIVAVEPANSPILSGGQPGPHKIQGIGAGFVPQVLNTQVYSRVIGVADEMAYRTSEDIAHREGVLVGISAGAAMWAAQQVAADLGPDKDVVVIFPDTGERYLSLRS